MHTDQPAKPFFLSLSRLVPLKCLELILLAWELASQKIEGPWSSQVTVRV